ASKWKASEREGIKPAGWATGKSTRGSAPRSSPIGVGNERRGRISFSTRGLDRHHNPWPCPPPLVGNIYKLCRFYRLCLPWDLGKASTGVDLFFLPQALNRKG